MEITVTRIDPMAGIPDSHDPVVITKQSFDDWPEAFDYIRSFGVNLLPLHEEEIRNHPSTQFSNREFLNAGHTACAVSVMYDVTTTAEEQQNGKGHA